MLQAKVFVFEGRFDIPCSAGVMRKIITFPEIIKFEIKCRVFHNYHLKGKSFFNLL